jgi:nucleoside-diphosphate-sugar epimerase
MNSKPSVLVLGATGFVGKNLLPRLSNSTAKITAVYRNRPAKDVATLIAQSPNIKWVDASLGLVSAVRLAAAADPIDIVIHLAGKINGTAAELRQGNVVTTRDLLAALDEVRGRPRIVYLSSVSAIDRLGQYGQEKRSAEDAIVAWTTNYICLRSSLIYGPLDSNNVAKLIGAVKRWPVIPVPGGRAVLLQPLYVDDLCDAICRAAFDANVNGSFVVAGPRQEKLWDMLRIIQHALSRNQLLVPVSLGLLQRTSSILTRVAPWLPLPMQQINTLHNHPPWSSEQARDALGFSPRFFMDGIAQYLKVSKPAATLNYPE